jgi:hypothetical protein
MTAQNMWGRQSCLQPALEPARCPPQENRACRGTLRRPRHPDYPVIPSEARDLLLQERQEQS